MASSTRRLPKPFARPSIDLSVPNRSWRTAPVAVLTDGDIVPDHGRVVRVSVSANVAIEFLSGEVEFYPLDATLWAFTRSQ
jgi:hypothetical protein